MEDELEYDDATPDEGETSNPISDMIGAALGGDYVQADKMFADILGDRVTDALDQEKIKVANSIYGNESEEDDLDTDITDEEIEAELSDDPDMDLDDILSDES